MWEGIANFTVLHIHRRNLSPNSLSKRLPTRLISEVVSTLISAMLVKRLRSKYRDPVLEDFENRQPKLKNALILKVIQSFVSVSSSI